MPPLRLALPSTGQMRATNVVRPLAVPCRDRNQHRGLGRYFSARCCGPAGDSPRSPAATTVMNYRDAAGAFDRLLGSQSDFPDVDQRQYGAGGRQS